MLFNSQVFLYLFLPIVWGVHFRLSGKNSRFVWLTLASYVFYGYWDYRFCFLMAFSTLVSYSAGLGLLRWEGRPAARKLCLAAAVGVDLSLLGFFKYFNFAALSLQQLASLFRLTVDVPLYQIVLPVGISFYTFHTITYMVDAYRGTIRPTRNLFEFACYVSLFSQLVAGPIVRFAQVNRELAAIHRHRRTQRLNEAFSFLAIGMVKKVLVADTIALAINPAFQNYAALSTLDAWLCVLGYAYQLYFDFSGYSDMAVGLGRLFNIHIPQNFNSPYRAASISDFWSRWHISLSTCMRDYLYIPLGGNRHGEWKTYRNLLITFGLGGLWHGASWTFVVWGLYHGVLVCGNRALAGQRWHLPRLPAQALTFLLVLIGWVFFRSNSLHMAGTLLTRMFVAHGGAALAGRQGLTLLLAAAAIAAHGAPNAFEMRHEWRPAQALALGGLFALALLIVASGTPSPFLYFQF